MSLRDLPQLLEMSKRISQQQKDRNKRALLNCLISLCAALPGMLIVAHFTSWWVNLGIFLMLLGNNISQSKDIP